MKFDNVENLVIYGTGKCAEACVEKLRIDIEDVDVVSSFPDQRLLGKSAKQLSELSKEVQYNVIIASDSVNEIYQIIEKSNINFSDKFCFSYLERKLVKVDDFLRLNQQDETLYAFYDLEVSGASYDAVIFANAVEEYRQKIGFDKICFVVVPPIKKFGNDGLSTFYQGEEAEFISRVRNLLIPIFYLIPSTLSCIELPNRSLAALLLEGADEIYPKKYEIGAPISHTFPGDVLDLSKPLGHLKAPVSSVKYIKEFFSKYQNKKIITFTIREYLNQPYRNNDLNELALYLNYLKGSEYLPVLVRDTCNAGKGELEGIRNCIYLPEASLNLGVRMALYEMADLNVFVNNGPAALAIYSKECRYIIFNFSRDEDYCTSKDYYKNQYNLNFGDTQYTIASNPYQRICWEKDSFEVMKENVSVLFDELESQRK